MWFEKIFGFKETKENIDKYIEMEGGILISTANGKAFQIGKLEVISLKELYQKRWTFWALDNKLIDYNEKEHSISFKKIKISECYSDVAEYHIKTPNALFQVASQFNLLEMMSPENSPEQGISIYQYDKTQGPACAMACVAGTLYRNYFTKINTLDLIEKLLSKKYWNFKNGYILFEDTDGFEEEVLSKKELIKDNLKVGIQWDTEVIGTSHTVSQIYCSAVPVSYNDESLDLEAFSRIILEAAYEATFLAAIMNRKSNIVYLTLLGGGAFGNKKEWIYDAIEKNIEKFKHYDLDVRFVSYLAIPNENIQKLIKKYN